MEEVITQLKLVLANSYALYLNTQNYHWNVTGHNFYSLHNLFEEQYKEQADALDEIAESMRIAGLKVEASFGHFNQYKTIPDANKDYQANEMIQDLISGHTKLIECLESLNISASNSSNRVIEDLAIQRIISHQKQKWMLLSLLA
jgi:starvation-inducible DNA-binding protein